MPLATTTTGPTRPRTGRTRRRAALGVRAALPVVAVLALLAALVVPGGGLPGAGLLGQPTATLTAPASVGVGEPLTVELRLTGADGLAGLEADLALDTTAAGLDDVLLSAGPLDGRPVRALPTARRDGGVSVGLHTCAAPSCPAPLAVLGDPGTLAALALSPARAGVYEVRVDALHGVDAEGRRVDVRVDDAVIRVAVGQVDDAAPVVAAPAAALPAAPVVPAPGDPAATGEHALAVLAADWLLARERGPSCTGARTGVADDGCLDVGDLQALATGQARGDGVVLQATTTSTSTTTTTTAAAAGRTLTVTSTGDETDAAPGDGVCRTGAGTCTLRAALTESNALAGHDTVAFAIPGTGPHTLRPADRYPYLADSAGVMIDGYTQPGSAPNTHPQRSDAVLKISIRGTGGTGIDGLVLVGPGTVVRGLAMPRFRRPVWLLAENAVRNTVVGNWLGIDARAGDASGPNNTAIAVVVQNGASDNRIGGPAPADRNVLSGNGDHGIAFYNGGTARNVVQGNIIGLSPDGTRAIPNHSHGVDLNSGTTDTLVGGDRPGEGNVVSGNRGEGVEVSHGAGTVNNSVIGNLVGADPAGQPRSHTGNAFRGIHVEGGPAILGPNLVRGNVVVGNALGGVLVDRGVQQATITGNRIGVTAGGVVAGNGEFGVRLQSGASDNTVGPDNVIRGNAAGVQLRSQGFVGESERTWDNTITRNSIAANGGPGIDLEPLGTANANDPGDGDSGANTQLNTPVLSAPGPTTVTGTACAGCRVELFDADAAGQRSGAVGSGERFLTAATADGSGAFSATVSGVAGRWVTATATSPAGSTSEFSRTVQVPAAPAGNGPPTAAFTSSCTGLGCTVDGGGSTDGDGTVVGWTWSFGDGGTATGRTASHTYAAAGTYAVRLTVTDDDGATASTTRDVTVAAPTGQVALDRFGRSTTTGWGRAEAGGTWSVPYAVDQLSVSGGTGRMAVAPGTSRYAGLPDARVRDSDTTVAAALDRAPTGGDAYVYVASRQTRDISTQYRARLRLTAGGEVLLGLSAVDGSEASARFLAPDAVVPGLSVAAGQRYLVRLQTAGASPTTLRAKVWRDGADEPARWAVTATDSTPSLQTAGGTALRAYVTSGAAATVVSFDDLQVTELAAPPPPPPPGPQPGDTVAADGYARTATGGWGTADTGGPWTTSGTAFSVGSGAGRVDVPPGVSRLALLPDVAVRDVDLRVALTLPELPTGGGLYAYVLTRQTDDLTSYRTRVRVLADGRVLLGVSRTTGSQAETTVVPDAVVPGLTATAGTPLLVRTRATGAGPTTVQAKVWRAGRPEPTAWAVTGTDSTAPLQSAGAVGLRAYASGSATRTAVLRVDDLRAVVAG